MKLIFCLSYLNVPKTIALAEGGFIIITQDKDLYKFLEQIYTPEKLMYIEPSKLSIGRPILSALNFYSSWKKIFRLVKSHCESEVYFFLVSSAPSMAYAIKLLSKKNKLYYEPAALLNLKDAKSTPISTTIQKYRIRIIYGIEVSVKKIGRRFILPYSKSFFQEINCEAVKITLCRESIGAAMLRAKSGTSSASCILFVGGEVESGLANKEEFNAIIREVVETIGADNLAIKVRPSHREGLTFSGASKIIDNSIPGNMLIYQYKIVIGFHSAVLFEGANSGCVSISLMDLLSRENKGAIDDYKAYLRNNLDDGGSIHFPKSLKELRGMIK